ncbi:MAG: CinA family protein [Pseudomonadota bacterium]
MTAADLVEKYTKAGLICATAESCTGGLVAGAITDIPGSSAILDRGFVTYSNTAKHQMLGVPNALFDTVGAVSLEVAEAMAEGAVKNSVADIAVSITGIAGPGGSEFKPEGRVCFGLAQTGQPTVTEQLDFGAVGRAEVRRLSVEKALQLLGSAVAP